MERVETFKYLGVVFDSKRNWKENINSVLRKSELENVLLEKAEIFWSQFGHVSNFFHNVVICGRIVFGSACWGGNILKFDRRRFEKIERKKNCRSCCGKAIGQF